MMGIINWLIRFFKLFYDAVKACWDQLWKSFVMLVVLTVVLASVFYVYEAPHQAEYANWWQDLRWAFFSYIGDPGGFGGAGPVTFQGRVIATLLSVVNILIFAVPAGIIASGFTTALETDVREKQTAKNCEAIRQSFKPVQCRHTYFRCVPAYKSLVTLQVENGLAESDIIAAVKYAKDLRLRNIADIYSRDSEAQDRLVVELFPTAGARDYGCFVNRNSNVTIVCTSSHKEIGDSHFGYLLAEFGGFNFISRETDEAENSYYIVPDETSEPFKQFLSDLRTVSEGKDKWVVLLNQVQREIKSQLSFVTAYKPSGQNEIVTSTICEENAAVFEQAYNEIRSAIEDGKYKINDGEREHDEANRLHCDLNECFKPARGRNLGVKIGGGSLTNVFTLRVAAKLVARDRRDIPIAAKLAEIMRQQFVGDDSYQSDNTPRWKKKGVGY